HAGVIVRMNSDTVLMYSLVVVVALLLVGVIGGWLLWCRRSGQYWLPRPFRRIGVLASHLVLRLQMVLSRYHEAVFIVYIVIFASYFLRSSFLDYVGTIGEISVYCFYGLAIFSLLALFIARWLLDPVPKALTDDDLEPLDPAKVSLVKPDSIE